MAIYRIVRTNFWSNPVVQEEMTPEDRYFYLYLLTNPLTTQSGIYIITKKQMAFDLGYSLETVQSLMDRFTLHHKLIRYNPETRELAIKNWGKENLHKAGKPVMDCIASELKEVKDLPLIQYVADSIDHQDVKRLYESFCEQDTIQECPQQEENHPYIAEDNALDETLPTRSTTRGQKEKENKKEEEKQQQLVLYPSIENNPGTESPLRINPQGTRVVSIACTNDTQQKYKTVDST